MIVHFADVRRAEGLRWTHNGYGQTKQFPVICAADFVEQEVTTGSRREQVVTTDPARVRCADCKSRL